MLAPSRIAILLLLIVTYFGSAFSPALMDDADTTHAEVAREMIVRGDYVTLHVNGVRYLEKAPLMYWAVAASYRIFGVNEFATRMPTALTMLLMVVLAMKWARRAFGDRASVYAGIIVASTTGYYLFTRILIPDALLSLFIAAALYYFFTAMEDRQPWRWYAAYACVALGVLTKGLVAIAFVGFPAMIYVTVIGEWRRWREFRLGTGLLLLFVIAAPWHLLAGIRNHGFFWFYFVNEHFLRFLGKRYPKDYNKLPAVLYWSLHLIWLFPWSMYLPVAVQDLRRQLREGSDSGRATRTRLLCWIWAGFILVFFAISTNQEYYTLPAYFAVALLLAAALSNAEESPRTSRWLLWGTSVVAVLCTVGACILIGGLWTSRHIPYVADIGTVLAKHDLANDTLSMSHMLDLTGESFAALRLPAILAVVALLIGPTAATWLRFRRRQFAATWALAGTMALFLFAAHIALGRFSPYMSSKNLAQVLNRQAQPADDLMIYGDQAYGSSLLFYTGRPFYLVNGRSSSMWFGSTFPDAPRIYLKSPDLAMRWNSDKRVFIFVSPYGKAEFEALHLAPVYVIAESSGKTIYSNRPGGALAGAGQPDHSSAGL